MKKIITYCDKCKRNMSGDMIQFPEDGKDYCGRCAVKCGFSKEILSLKENKK